jgi:hypothetical protein
MPVLRNPRHEKFSQLVASGVKPTEAYVSLSYSKAGAPQSTPNAHRILRQTKFLAAFAACGRILSASRAAQVHRSSHYVWMRNDPTYPARFKAARQWAGTMLQDEAVERAVHGMRRPTLYKGRAVRINGRVLYESVYSNRLLIHLLEVLMPEKYGR